MAIRHIPSVQSTVLKNTHTPSLHCSQNMAYSHLLPIGFCVLLFFHGCFAQLERPQQRIWQELQEGQQHRLRGKTPCNIQRLNAQQPSIKIQSEAGVHEFWNSNNSPEFECAGVELERIVINSRGLLQPHYSNSPKLVYVVQGKGVLGLVIPGCAETFESQGQGSFGGGQGQGQGQGQVQGQGQRFSDRHQKLRRIQQGDIFALPPGFTHWAYNDGGVPLVFVQLLDVANEANQLDLQFREFFLAGNPLGQSQGQQGKGQGGQRQHRNIFSGFDDDLLSNAFNTRREIINRLKGQEDKRGMIVNAEELQLSLPEFDEEEQRQRQQQQQQQEEGQQQGQYGGGGGPGKGWRPNGLEETICSVKLRENIAHPSRTDLFNPRAGRISTVNSQSLPILSWIQLSAQHANLYSNAIVAPHWNINAHCILYVIRGNARIQVVGDSGNQVFDDEVSQGQAIIVPQNFAVIQKAGNEGFEYISFKTNDNAMSSQIAGRLSTLRAIPSDVLENAYRISREEVKDLKYGRQEAVVFSGSQSQGRRESA